MYRSESIDPQEYTLLSSNIYILFDDALAFEIQRGFRCSAVGVGHRSFHFLPCLAVHEYGSFVFPQSGRCVVLVLIVVASRESQHYGRESE